MEVKFGTSRIVFLIGDKAIKIARIRLVRCVLRILTFPLNSDGDRERFCKKYGSIFIIALIRYIFFGIYANKMEFIFSKHHPTEKRIMPTMGIYLWGFIVIQQRGLPVTVEKLRTLNPFKGLRSERYHEVEHPTQFCEFEGKILLVDYGHKKTCKFLLNTA